MAGRRGSRGQARFYALLALALAVVMFAGAVSEYRKFAALAAHGKGALATVVSYEPTRSRYTKGTTTYHYHVLAFDGIVEHVELPRAEAPGARIRIVYLPDDPKTVALGQPGMSTTELMGGELAWLVLFVLAGSGLLLCGVRMLRPSRKREGPTDPEDLGRART